MGTWDFQPGHLMAINPGRTSNYEACRVVDHGTDISNQKVNASLVVFLKHCTLCHEFQNGTICGDQGSCQCSGCNCNSGYFGRHCQARVSGVLEVHIMYLELCNVIHMLPKIHSDFLLCYM